MTTRSAQVLYHWPFCAEGECDKCDARREWLKEAELRAKRSVSSCDARLTRDETP